MITARARVGQCQAYARTRGRQCHASAVFSGRCWFHGGAGLKKHWTISDDGKGPVVWPEGQEQRRSDARPIQKHAAVELIRRGVIRRGLFFRWPARFIRRIERAGVRVITERAGLVKSVRFEVMA
jgi:hypothetical protein